MIERRMYGDVIVSYSIIITRPIAKPVRRLSISYIDTCLSNGTIFDKNMGYSEGVRGKGGNGGPLKFRNGTRGGKGGALKVWGEVWRGWGGGWGGHPQSPRISVTVGRDQNSNDN